MSVRMSNPYDPVPEEIVAHWIASLDIEGGSARAYKAGLKAFCAYVRSTSLDFDNLEATDVQGYKAYLLNEKGLSPATVSLYLAGLRSFYRYSDSNGVKDIAHGIKGASSGRDFKKAALSPSDATRMLKAIDRTSVKGLRDYAIVNLLVRTGLRTCEVSAANVDDIGWLSGERVLYVKGKGRKGKDDFVLLTDTTYSPIKAYLESRRITDDGGKEPLFVSLANSNRGERLGAKAISGIAKEAMARIGFNDSRHTAHSLRHTAITLALLAGAEVEDAKEMARHADISTTMKYAHHVKRLKNAGEKMVDQILGDV